MMALNLSTNSLPHTTKACGCPSLIFFAMSLANTPNSSNSRLSWSLQTRPTVKLARSRSSAASLNSRYVSLSLRAARHRPSSWTPGPSRKWREVRLKHLRRRPSSSRPQAVRPALTPNVCADPKGHSKSCLNLFRCCCNGIGDDRLAGVNISHDCGARRFVLLVNGHVP